MSVEAVLWMYKVDDPSQTTSSHRGDMKIKSWMFVKHSDNIVMSAIEKPVRKLIILYWDQVWRVCSKDKTILNSCSFSEQHPSYALNDAVSSGKNSMWSWNLRLYHNVYIRRGESFKVAQANLMLTFPNFWVLDFATLMFF